MRYAAARTSDVSTARSTRATNTRLESYNVRNGTGRTGRLLLILVWLEWPPTIILKERRGRYLKALGRADDGDYGPLAEVIARSVIGLDGRYRSSRAALDEYKASKYSRGKS